MRRLTMTAVFMALALLASCGPQPSSAQELVASSAAATQEAGSANMATEIRMAGGAQEMSITATGAFDFVSGRGAMTMNLGEMGAQMGMSDIEMRTDGTVMYLKMPPQMNAPTPWVKTDLDAAAGAQGLGGMGQFNNNDPRSALEMLRGVAEVEEVGAEDVRGTPTTRYKATVDLDKALAETSGEAKEALQQQIDMLGTSEMPVDVWIDEEGLLRRQEVTMDLSKMNTGTAAPAQAPTSMFMRMELFDFGTTVDVEPPPADQVTDMAEMQQGGGG